MPIRVSIADNFAGKFHVSRKTGKTQIRSNRNLLEGIKTKSARFMDMGGVDPKATASGKTTKRILGGMGAGAGAGFLVGGPFGALVGALVGAVGGATADMLKDDDKNNKK